MITWAGAERIRQSIGWENKSNDSDAARIPKGTGSGRCRGEDGDALFSFTHDVITDYVRNHAAFVANIVGHVGLGENL